MQPGELVDCLNVECLVNGGYGSIDGYQKLVAQEVPGIGSVLAVHRYKGDVYAIRDSATEGCLYRLDGAVWTKI